MKKVCKKFLKEKIVILATHQIHFLPFSTKVIVLDKGCMSY